MRILLRAGLVAAIALTATACDGLLKVSNPGSLQETQLTDPALEQFLINGVIGEYQVAYANYAFWSGVLSDETFTDHPNTNARELSAHNFTDLNTFNDSVYKTLQRARQSADDAVDRIKKMQGANAGASLNVARALIYGGYSYILLGEGFCDSPVNLSAPLSSDELLARAIARFDEGIAVATAARVAPNEAIAQDLISLAHIGAARAALKKRDLSLARAHAVLVPPDGYERLAYYSANSPRENNALQIAVRTGQPWLGMQAVFRNLSDARAPEPASPRISLGANPIFPPLKPSMYGGWTGIGAAQTIEVATSIRFASSLEARYIIAEADGPTGGMLSFVNSRRASAGKAPVDLSGAALIAEFRAQRALDFYLTGQRLGDLRRYALAGTDLFPTGKHPVRPEPFGTMHCFIVPRSEKAGNPNY